MNKDATKEFIINSIGVSDWQRITELFEGKSLGEILAILEGMFIPGYRNKLAKAIHTELN